MKMEKAEYPGIPPHIPTSETRAEVSALVAYGIKQEQIAKRLRISVDTLAKHYGHELEMGLANAINEVANVLFSKAVDDRDLGAVIFFLKTRGRWREKDPEENKQAMSIIESLLEKIPQQK